MSDRRRGAPEATRSTSGYPAPTAPSGIETDAPAMTRTPPSPPHADRLFAVLAPLLPEAVAITELVRPVSRGDATFDASREGGADAGRAVVLRRGTGGSLASRLARLVSARRDLRRVGRALAGSGFPVVTVYGVYPSAADAAILVELEGPAARYAARAMLPRGRGPARRTLELAFDLLRAPPPCLDDFVVVGERP